MNRISTFKVAATLVMSMSSSMPSSTPISMSPNNETIETNDGSSSEDDSAMLAVIIVGIVIFIIVHIILAIGIIWLVQYRLKRKKRSQDSSESNESLIILLYLKTVNWQKIIILQRQKPSFLQTTYRYMEVKLIISQ